MFDTIKDYISPKRFSVVAYLCVILHFTCGIAFSALLLSVRDSEMEKFSCAVDTNVLTRKVYIEKECFAMYDEVYNSSLRFSAFIPLSFGLLLVVGIVYFFFVTSRVGEIEKLLNEGKKPKTLGKKTNKQQDRKSFYVFKLYLYYLVARFVLGLSFSILQQTLLYPSGFKTLFDCVYQALPDANLNTTTANNGSAHLSNAACKNFTAPEKQLYGAIVCALNVVFAIFPLGEVIYLILRRRFHTWSCDAEFVVVYFLRQQYSGEYVRLTKIDVDNSSLRKSEMYKKKVLEAFRTPDINYGRNTSLDEMFVDVVIQTEQAPHNFSKNMDRHEIYDVYMAVPKYSILLERIKDLFSPDKDTRWKLPRTILVLGRPGIGKTVLTRKIMRDWAKHTDHVTTPSNGNGTKEFYQDKIVFFYKFREFRFEQFQKVTLETFLYYGTVGLSEEEFQSIFEEILNGSKEAVFIFDGLDELSGDLAYYLDQSKLFVSDISTPTPPAVLFINLVSRCFDDFLQRSTIMVTSRPSVYDIYSKLPFDRTVEILGFTTDKIEEYVGRFCDNVNKTYSYHKTSTGKDERTLNKEMTDDAEEVDDTEAKIYEDKKSDLKRKIWGHISSSSQLRNCCYIPVNCFIVCVTLLKRLIDPRKDVAALPTTLTELYQAAVSYFSKYHDRKEKNQCQENVLKDLRQLAFFGMENDQQLIFDDELVNEQMKESGLLHCLPSPFFQIQTQVCFIHLTVQEFLAAKHIVETKTPEEVKQFITSHFKEGKWHLVLQFVAGLLGKKFTIACQYRCCISSFTQHFRVETIDDDVVCELTRDAVLGIKCVSEMENDEIAAEIAATSALKTVTRIPGSGCLLFPSDWTALVFVCKHLQMLTSLCILKERNLNCLLEATKLLQQRCIEVLVLPSCLIDDVVLQHVLDALMKSKCHMDHGHSKLTKLNLALNEVTDAGFLQLCQYLNVHGSHLQELNLGGNKITLSGMSMLNVVLSNEVCGRLQVLDFSYNDIGNDGACILFQALKENQFKLTELNLHYCRFTSECLSLLADVLSDEHCEITNLFLHANEILDTGVRILCEALKTKHCKLVELSLSHCSLTDECMPFLCGALRDKRCCLRKLDLGGNPFRDNGIIMLFEALRTGQCKLAELDLYDCAFTDGCMPSLCEALGDEQFNLVELNVSFNDFTDEHLSSFSDSLKLKHCSLRCLDIARNKLTREGEQLLFDTEKSENCKARGFKIAGF